jgi:HlyD family secretion protein
MATAEAEVESARAAYEVAKTQKDYGELVSPVSGWVVSENARAGEVVGVGTEVFVLANLDDVWSQVYVDERYGQRIQNGQRVILIAEDLDDREFEGVISGVFFQSRKDRMQRAYRVRSQVANEGHLLKPGMEVTIVVLE